MIHCNKLFGISLFLSSGFLLVVDSFPPGAVPPVVTGSYKAAAAAAAPSINKPDASATVPDDFWSQTRSKEEVQSHVLACLASVADQQAAAATDPTSTLTHPVVTERVEVVSSEPPLVAIHNFISPQMCNDIIESAKENENWKQSTLGSEQKKSEDRTSSTVWLKDAECQDPSRLIAAKVASLTGLDTINMENLQVVRYDRGQAFNLHTDHQDTFNELDFRGRLATCLIYLSEPEMGGETWFPGLASNDDDSQEEGIKIAPIMGSAVFFWNTMEKPGIVDYDPNMFLNTDIRMRHAGLPVDQGEKWICNRWIHPVDFGAGVRGI
jgi:prolyl 4-hydroxylase